MDLKYYKRRYCSDIENVENYEKAKADDFIGWECHHRLETHTPDGKRRAIDIPAAELIALGMYYHRPPEELIFLTSREHSSLRKVSEETKNKIGAALKGENNPFYGKHLSVDHKKKIGEAKKGNTYAKGMHWYNNGKENKYCYECPEGFTPGVLRK